MEKTETLLTIAYQLSVALHAAQKYILHSANTGWWVSIELLLVLAWLTCTLHGAEVQPDVQEEQQRWNSFLRCLPFSILLAIVLLKIDITLSETAKYLLWAECHAIFMAGNIFAEIRKKYV